MVKKNQTILISGLAFLISEFVVLVLKNCHRKGIKLNLNVFDDKIRAHALHKVRPRNVASPCSAGDKTLSIAPSGRIYPCVQFVKDDSDKDAVNAIGHIGKGLNPSHQNRFRSGLSYAPSSCQSCAFFDRCNNHCACANWQSSGDPATPAAFLCEHERMLIPIADDVGKTLWKERNPLFINKTYNETYALESYLDDTLDALEDEKPWRIL